MNDETASQGDVVDVEPAEPVDPADPVGDVVEPRADDAPAEVADGSETPTIELTEDAVIALIAERDEYLDALQRQKAEFANARRRLDEQATRQRQQAGADLVERLLPILDSCDAAVSQGIEQVQPISDALFEVLADRGLARLDPAGEPFDPQLHEAVLHEDGDGEQIVVETLRTGYSFNDRVLRAAMVKVQG